MHVFESEWVRHSGNSTLQVRPHCEAQLGGAGGGQLANGSVAPHDDPSLDPLLSRGSVSWMGGLSAL